MLRSHRLIRTVHVLSIALVLVLAGLAVPRLASAQTCSSVRYDAPSGAAHSIEFSFASPVECGQYANGDWWVVAPVQVTSITPAATTGRHGCEVNPRHFNQNPYDSRTGNYNTATLCTVPQTFNSGTTSIVKAVSTSTDCAGNHCLEFAAVLTVVDSAPSDPANTFRPPWFGTSKPSRTYRVSDLMLDRMPSLPRNDPQFAGCCSREPSVEDVAVRFRHIQLGDHLDRHHQRRVKPRDNFTWQNTSHDYHAEMAADNAVSLLRLMLDDLDWNDPTHLRTLVYYVQAGIDMYWILDRGLVWANHSMGRKILPTAAAHLLDDADIAAIAGSSAPGYGENTTVFRSARADSGRGKTLWGRTPNSEADYWRLVETDGGDGYRWWGDPYGYVDGAYAYGDSGHRGYQYCCSSKGMKYESLAVRLLGAAPVFNHPDFHEYADRWVDHGYFTANDVCAPYDGNASNRGVTYGPAPGNSPSCVETRTCDCIRGSGRFQSADGTHADEGYYSVGFGDDMWSAFRPCLEPGANCDIGSGGTVVLPLPDPEPDPEPDPQVPPAAPLLLPPLADDGGSASTGTDALYRVNAGGPAYVDGAGNSWQTDTGLVTDGLLTSNSHDFAGTQDDALYQTQRYNWVAAETMRFDLPVAAGGVVVNLHFGEGYEGITGAGQRVFDVRIEGDTVLAGYDIYGDVGPQAAVVKTFSADVQDGSLTITFMHQGGAPTIAAIEVLPAQ
jgi:hypothetical protein